MIADRYLITYFNNKKLQDGDPINNFMGFSIKENVLQNFFVRFE